MRHFSILFLGAILALLLHSAQGGGADDPTADKWEKAKATYDKEMMKARMAVAKYFDAEETKARNAGNKKRLDELKVQRKAFEDDMILPATAPASLQKMMKAPLEELRKTYKAALTVYLRMKQDDLATALEKEWKERESKDTAKVVEPKAIGLRQAAQALHTYARLEIQSTVPGTPWKVKSIGPDDPLPADGYAITGVYVESNKSSPTFVDEILLPSLASVTTLRTLWCPTFALTDDQLTQLAKFPCASTVTSIQCPGIELTSNTIDALKKFTNLKMLWCSAKTADDAILGRLKDLPPLTSLHLNGLGDSGKVTKKGLEKLAGFPLMSLYVQSSPAANGDLLQVAATFPKLVGLTLEGGTIVDDDLKVLSQFRNLRDLHLRGTQITDAGLVHLLKGPNLSVLSLGSSAITDDGVLTLAKITSLVHLDLVNTKVTEAGGKKLAKARPDLRIVLANGVMFDPKRK